MEYSAINHNYWPIWCMKAQIEPVRLLENHLIWIFIIFYLHTMFYRQIFCESSNYFSGLPDFGPKDVQQVLSNLLSYLSLSGALNLWFCISCLESGCVRAFGVSMVLFQVREVLLSAHQDSIIQLFVDYRWFRTAMNMAWCSSLLFCATATSTRQHCSSDWLLGEITVSLWLSVCFVVSVLWCLCLCFAKTWWMDWTRVLQQHMPYQSISQIKTHRLLSCLLPKPIRSSRWCSFFCMLCAVSFGILAPGPHRCHKIGVVRHHSPQLFLEADFMFFFPWMITAQCEAFRELAES